MYMYLDFEVKWWSWNYILKSSDVHEIIIISQVMFMYLYSKWQYTGLEQRDMVHLLD